MPLISNTQLVLLAVLVFAFCLLIDSLSRRKRLKSGSAPGIPKDLFEDALVGYLQLDKNGFVERVNRKECELRGISQAQILGKHFTELSPAHSRERERRSFERKISRQDTLEVYQVKLQRPDGAVVAVEVRETLLLDGAGKVIGMRSATMDITDREKSEERALETASELKALFQAFPDLFLRLDAEGNVLDCKGGDTEKNLLSPQTFAGRRLHDALPSNAADLLVEAAATVRRTNEVEIVEYSGSENQFYECRMLPLYWDHTVAVLRDISDRKIAEKDLARCFPKATSFCRNEASHHTFSSVSAIARGDAGSNRRPALPSTSGMDVASAATTGHPAAMDSTRGMPKPSKSDGKTNMRARLYR